MLRIEEIQKASLNWNFFALSLSVVSICCSAVRELVLCTSLALLAVRALAPLLPMEFTCSCTWVFLDINRNISDI
jgi:hypothetical protein